MNDRKERPDVDVLIAALDDIYRNVDRWNTLQISSRIRSALSTRPAEATSRDGVSRHPHMTTLRAKLAEMEAERDAALSREKEARAEGWDEGYSAAEHAVDQLGTSLRYDSGIYVRAIENPYITPTASDAAQQGER